MTLGLMPSTALLNDDQSAPDQFLPLARRGLTITLAMKNESENYCRCRAPLQPIAAGGEADTAEAASLFYYLNRTGYNGLCRFNRQGHFNVPFGHYRKIDYRTDFAADQPVFSRFEFTHTDFEQLALGPDDFIYADPPYDVEFTHYSSGGFGWDEQTRAAEWLAKHPGPVVLSNQRTGRIEEACTGSSASPSPSGPPRSHQLHRRPDPRAGSAGDAQSRLPCPALHHAYEFPLPPGVGLDTRARRTRNVALQRPLSA